MDLNEATAPNPNRRAPASPTVAPSGSSGRPAPLPGGKRNFMAPVPKLFGNHTQSPWSQSWATWSRPWQSGEDSLPQDLALDQVWAVSWASVTGEGLVLVQASPEQIAQALGKQTIALERWDGTLAVLKPDGQAERLSPESVRGYALGASQAGDLYRIPAPSEPPE